MRTRERIGVGDALMLLPALFIGLFFLFPVGTVLWRGPGRRGTRCSLRSREVTAAARRSLVHVLASAVSTALTVAVALPAAATVGGLSDRARRFVRSLVTVPFVLPPWWSQARSTNCSLRRGSIPVTSAPAHRLGDPDRPRLLQLCGRCAGRGHCVRRTRRSSSGGCESARRNSLAGVAGGDAAAASAGDCLSLGDRLPFLVHVVRCSADLGGPKRATLETEIYRYAVSRTDLTRAAALAVVQLVAVLALVAVSTWLERRRPATTRMARPTRTLGSRPGRWLNVGMATALLGAPLAVLIERSFSTAPATGSRTTKRSARGSVSFRHRPPLHCGTRCTTPRWRLCSQC